MPIVQWNDIVWVTMPIKYHLNVLTNLAKVGDVGWKQMATCRQLASAGIFPYDSSAACTFLLFMALLSHPPRQCHLRYDHLLWEAAAHVREEWNCRA